MEKKKEMDIIGLDISVNATALCHYKNGKYNWYFFAPNVTDRTKKYDNFKQFDNFNLIPFVKNANLNKDNYTLDTLNKINNYSILKTKIINTLYSIITPDTVIKIEGPSYNSFGKASKDIIYLNYLIIGEISSTFSNDIEIIPPATVKKTAGKGNLSKDKMLKAFKELKDRDIVNDDVYKHICTYDKSKKPYEDLIDAYYIIHS
jgi:hypothetical protein